MSNYNALHLKREGRYIVLEIEVNKEWIEIIREFAADDAPIGHIIEPLGIERAIEEYNSKKPKS